MINIEEKDITPLAELYKAFSDETRLRILSVLADGQMCVGDIASALNMTDSAISHQLKSLKTARLVKAQRDGKQMYYSLDDDHVRTLFLQGLEHIRHE